MIYRVGALGVFAQHNHNEVVCLGGFRVDSGLCALTKFNSFMAELGFLSTC